MTTDASAENTDEAAENTAGEPSTETEPDLGYTFHPRRYPHAPGHPQLDIVLRSTPSGQHFDPEEIELEVASGSWWGIGKLTLRYPCQSGQHRLVAGPVHVRDRSNKLVEAFIFGGSLQVTTDEARSLCVMTSSAPIIGYSSAPLTHGPTVNGMLVEEVEALIARRRANWNREHHPDTFNERLASVEPLTLYCACLQALDEKFGGTPHEAKDSPTEGLARFLRNEIKALREMEFWPREVPSLESLL